VSGFSLGEIQVQAEPIRQVNGFSRRFTDFFEPGQVDEEARMRDESLGQTAEDGCIDRRIQGRNRQRSR